MLRSEAIALAIKDGMNPKAAARVVDVALGRDKDNNTPAYRDAGNKYLAMARPAYDSFRPRSLEAQVVKQQLKQEKAAADEAVKKLARIKGNVAKVMSDAAGRARKKKNKKKGRSPQGAFFSSSYSVPTRFVGNSDDNSIAPLINTFGHPKIMNGHSPLVQAIFGHSIDGDPRWPDTFTMVPTSTLQSHSIIDLASTAGAATYDRHLCFALAGSPSNSMRYAMTCTAFVPAWNTGTYAHAGMTGTSHLSRPIGITCCLTYKPIGTAHDISLSVLPTEPILLSAVAAAPTNWPVDVRIPLTTGQAVAGARTFSMTSGDEVCINLLPVDPLSVTFEVGSTARSVDVAWTGAAVWAYGLADGDILEAHLIYTEEYFTNSAAPAPVTGGNPTLNPPNTNFLDKALTTVESLVARGCQIYKTVEGYGSTIAEALGGSILASALGMTISCNPVGYLNTMKRRNPPLRQRPSNGHDEEKDSYDASHEPQLSSFRSSSSSSSGRGVDSDTPRGGMDKLPRAGRTQ